MVSSSTDWTSGLGLFLNWGGIYREPTALMGNSDVHSSRILTGRRYIFRFGCIHARGGQYAIVRCGALDTMRFFRFVIEVTIIRATIIPVVLRFPRLK